ncbi:MAG: hypothetical protein ACRENM_00120 [Candidatus Dormibacteraceae bacterium]
MSLCWKRVTDELLTEGAGHSDELAEVRRLRARLASSRRPRMEVGPENQLEGSEVVALADRVATEFAEPS